MCEKKSTTPKQGPESLEKRPLKSLIQMCFSPLAIAPVVCLASSRHTCNAHTDNFIPDE